jgi:hypothetical protein
VLLHCGNASDGGLRDNGVGEVSLLDSGDSGSYCEDAQTRHFMYRQRCRHIYFIQVNKKRTNEKSEKNEPGEIKSKWLGSLDS